MERTAHDVNRDPLNNLEFLRKQSFWGIRCTLFAVAIWMVWGSAAGKGIEIVLRYDDYANHSNIENERLLMSEIAQIGASLVVCAIPFENVNHTDDGTALSPPVTSLSAEKLALLKDYISRGVVEPCVHGYNHQNTSKNAQNSELVGVSAALQSRWLGAGKSAFESALNTGVAFFSPPWNQFDTATLDALENNRYQLLLAGRLGPYADHRALAYLPGTTYPQDLAAAIQRAKTRGAASTIIAVSMHPYDFIGGDEMGGGRNANQMRVSDFMRQLTAAMATDDIKIIPVAQMIKHGEDLSWSRLDANLGWFRSYITRHQLIPFALNLYPDYSFYYSRSDASRMRRLQLFTGVSFYLLVSLIAAALVRWVIRLSSRPYQRVLATSLVAIGLGALYGLYHLSELRPIYMKAACLSALIAGVVVGSLSIATGDLRRRRAPRHGL